MNILLTCNVKDFLKGKRMIYYIDCVAWIMYSEFRDGDEYCILYTEKNGLSLGFIKLCDIIKT